MYYYIFFIEIALAVFLIIKSRENYRIGKTQVVGFTAISLIIIFSILTEAVFQLAYQNIDIKQSSFLEVRIIPQVCAFLFTMILALTISSTLGHYIHPSPIKIRFGFVRIFIAAPILLSSSFFVVYLYRTGEMERGILTGSVTVIMNSIFVLFAVRIFVLVCNKKDKEVVKQGDRTNRSKSHFRYYSSLNHLDLVCFEVSEHIKM